MQMRRKGQFCFVMTLLSRLYAFQNKRIVDRRLTTYNGYSNFPISVSNQPSGSPSPPPPPPFRVLDTKCLHDIQSRLFENDDSLFFSYVFWLGDLNYRINETIDNIKGICGKKEYSTLWKHDQVDNLFHSHYLEGRATFPAIPVWNATWQLQSRNLFLWIVTRVRFKWVNQKINHVINCLFYILHFCTALLGMWIIAMGWYILNRFVNFFYLLLSSC